MERQHRHRPPPSLGRVPHRSMPNLPQDASVRLPTGEGEVDYQLRARMSVRVMRANSSLRSRNIYKYQAGLHAVVRAAVPEGVAWPCAAMGMMVMVIGWQRTKGKEGTRRRREH